MEVGDIVQINPGTEVFGGCLMVVTDVYPWGVMGYIQIPGEKGAAYYRAKEGDFETTGGIAPWVLK